MVCTHNTYASLVARGQRQTDTKLTHQVGRVRVPQHTRWVNFAERLQTPTIVLPRTAKAASRMKRRRGSVCVCVWGGRWPPWEAIGASSCRHVCVRLDSLGSIIPCAAVWKGNLLAFCPATSGFGRQLPRSAFPALFEAKHLQTSAFDPLIVFGAFPGISPGSPRPF